MALKLAYRLNGVKIMKDKGLDIFLQVLFGIGGIIILVLVWARPMPLPERIVTAGIGLSGLSFSLSRAIPLKSVLTKIGVSKNLPETPPREK